MNQNKPRQNVAYTRNPMYVFYALGAVGLFILTVLFAQGPNVGVLEQAVFNVFYRLPDQLTILMRSYLLLGSLGLVASLSIISILRRRFDITIRLIASSVISYILCIAFASWFTRSSPSDLLSNVLPRIDVSAVNFPAILVAIATASSLTLSLYSARDKRKWLLYNVVAVAIAGIYLGLTLPLDVISGYSVGLFSFSIVSLGFGSIYNPIDLNKLTSVLRKGGIKGLVLKPASVDARGSVPFFGSYDKGPVFVKVFNQDNNAADWLFKLLRRVQYRRLEDEVPSLTPKRTIEHEAYITMLAKSSAGVRAPQVIGVFRVAHNSYAMATELIESDGLDKIEGKLITDKMLLEVWKQINILHEGRIIHKDLRCANIMIEKASGLPWIIDFGFSESAIDKKSFYKDNVEFIASSATKVGAKRAVEAAYKSLGRSGIKEALPYMQYAALSGATTTNLKKQKGLLHEIQEQMLRASKLKTSQYIKAKLGRINRPQRLHR